MKDESGIRPVEYKVLIKPEPVEEESSGGIRKPQDTIDKEKYFIVKGTLIATGTIAFTDPDWIDGPKIGDTVIYDKFAGVTVKGRDGEEYKLINDKEIGAIIYER